MGGKSRSGEQRLRLHYNQPNGIHWCHFHLHTSHKAVKSMAKLIGQSVNYSQLSACQGICSHLKATRTLMDVWQTSETSYSKSSPANFQHQYLVELLVNVYSYCLMVKSVSCCCVRGSWLFSDLVTIILVLFAYRSMYCVSIYR